MSEVAAEALNDLLEFNTACASQSNFKATAHNALASIHIDEGCYEDNVVAFGCVLRNSNKDIILAACRREFGSSDPTLV